LGEGIVTREQVRKLIGGYATGSLTEAERKLLFEAALTDQELFDELAGEQALKDVIDSPGARERLLAAVAPAESSRPAWWLRPWPWVGAAAAAAAAMVVWMISTPQPNAVIAPTEIAQAVPPAEPELPTPAPVEETTEPLRQETRVAPPAPPAEQAAAKTESAETLVVTGAPTAATEIRAEQQPIPAAPPPAALPKVAIGGARADTQSAGRATLLADALAAVLTAFDYAVADGSLRVVPAMSGYLRITANDDTGMFPANQVAAATPIVVPIPEGATEVTITFSLDPNPPAGNLVRRNEINGRMSSVDQTVLRLAIPAR
jgi:hypothetical protein